MTETGSTQPDSERRVATILFADISGFTAMSEKLEAETVTDLMNACFTAIGKVVESRGGVIDKYIGDCAMILFGAPRTVEGAPDKALRAALEIREALERVNAELKPPVPLRVHCGINTGTVIAGRVGSKGAMSYTVMGDSVNAAARLKEAAEPGQILVGGETRAQLREDFVLVERQPIAARGRAGGIPVWELLSAPAGHAQNEQTIGPGRPGLVGREAERSSLVRSVLQAETGEGSVLILTGESGIGKSRVVDELLASRATGGCQVLVGHCRPDDSKRSYHPFIEAIRTWAGEDARDSAGLAKRIAKVADVEAGKITPYVTSMLGLLPRAKDAEKVARIAGEGLEWLTQYGVRTLISRISEGKPLIFVVEDLHFADESSLELLESCLRLAVTKPILFILTVRPGYPEAAEWLRKVQHEWKTAKVRELRLPPLDLAASGLLVDALMEIRDFDPDLRRRIVEKSGGNPQFIQELVRSLSDGTELPSSIEEAFMVRIDRLDEDARDILRTASIVGLRVQLRVLNEAMSRPEGLDAGLRRLVDAGFLAEENREEGIEYHFLHEAARDVAYHSLVSSRRKELHLSIAEAIERTYAGREKEVAAFLALHYSRAELFDKAESYMMLAGESANAAANEAVSHYRDALELCLEKGRGDVDPEKIDSLEMNIARALYHKGRYREALPYYERLLVRRGAHAADGSLAASLCSAMGWAKMVRWIVFPDRKVSRPLPRELLEYSELAWEKCSMLATLADMKSLVSAAGIAVYRLRRYSICGVEALLAGMILISFILTWSGKLPSVGRRILDLTEPFLRPEFTRARLFHINMDEVWNLVSGNYSARWLFRDPLVGSQTDREGLLNALNTLYNSCTMSLEVGDWETFDEAHARLEEATEHFDTAVGRGYIESTALRTVMKRRDLAEAERTVPRIVDYFAETGYQAFRALDIASRVALMSGDLRRAAAEYGRAEKARLGHGGVAIGDGLHFGAAAAIAVERARASVAGGVRSGPVFRHGQAAVRRYLANSRKFAPDLVEALKFSGTLAWHSGKPKLALTYWQRSIAEAEHRDAKVELAHTLHDAGALLGPKEPGPEWRKRGAALYEKLGIHV